MLAVRWYLRYGLSYRDVEEHLSERGIVSDSEALAPHFALASWYGRSWRLSAAPVKIDRWRGLLREVMKTTVNDRVGPGLERN